ncbi:MAG TPA: glycine zipper domain-containing protein [Candidatus Limnocylindrales bacterium]|nr:glycine zipper domain-containing protein [Candidatus Limnocylindrales bacterium]
MRRSNLILLIMGVLLWVVGCAGYRTQTGAAIGAGAGALAGQAIGHTTESTLIGTALGGLTGAVIGNAMDTYDAQRYGYRYSPPPAGPDLGYSAYTPGYGRWVTIPGQWVNGQWVPEHQVWVPAGNPGR